MSNLVKLRPPKPLSDVRTGKPSDLGDVVAFLSGLRDEIDDGEIEPDLLISLATTLLNGRDGIVFIVRGAGNDRIEASIGILFERRRLARTYRLRVVWNLVAPSARRTTGHAASLLRAAVNFADALQRPIYLDASKQRPQMIELDNKAEPSPKIRLCSRHLYVAGLIFGHFPELAIDGVTPANP
jgi:hypothetical protein